MFDTMNNLSFIFNNRMDGIEIAESLLYKDNEKPFAHKFYHTKISDTCAYITGHKDVNKLLNNAGFDNNSMIFYEPNQPSANYAHGDNGNIINSYGNGNGCNQSSIDSSNFQNNFTDSVSKINYEINLESRHELENSSTYFRPISANNCDEFNYIDKTDINEKSNRDILESYQYNETLKENNKEKVVSEYPKESFYNIHDLYNVVKHDNSDFVSHNTESITKEESLLNNVFSFIKSTQVNTNTITDDTTISISNLGSICKDAISAVTRESTLLSGFNQLASFNNSQLNHSEDISSARYYPERPHNNSAAVIPVKMPITSILETAPITSMPSSSMGTTITIPRGSYIFIPLSVQNFQAKDLQQNLFQSSPTIGGDMNGNSKYIFGCYPMISQLHEIKVPSKQLPPIIPPKATYTQSTSIIITDPVELSKSTTSIIHPSQITNSPNIIPKQDKKKTESTEFNYYLNIISDCHKMLIKEKNKISMDRNVLEDDSWKNVINYAARNSSNNNKLEKELNLLINSLFEINVLISKIEAMRGTMFVEPLYTIIQNTAELIQSFHPSETFSQCSQRHTYINKPNEKDIEGQMEKLKLLFFNIQRIRSFLWASYTNFTIDRERSLSYSLIKLRSWHENKKTIRQSFKLKESNVKNQISTCNLNNGENLNSYHNTMSNSVRQTMKFDRNPMTVPSQSFTIPVSQYHQVPNRMTTIVQRFPNQILTNSPQYNYIHTSLSNYSHPTIINSNKFSIGSNCRLSYNSPQQLCSATPINATHNNIPSRNFLIAPSSLMTPIIYQNNPRPVINNASVNFMLYKTNTQMI